MTYNAAATSGAAAAAAVSNAIKASGAIVRVEPEDFLDILAKNPNPIVVQSPAGIFARRKYLTSYKGLFFCAKSRESLMIPPHVEIVNARRIYIPEL